MIAAAASSAQALWYLTRATGLVSLLLLTASVALGITEVTRWASPRLPRFLIAALHKNISLLVVVFLAVHIVTAVADSFAPIGWLDVVVPFHSPYRPVWLGLGAVAFDLLAALVVTSLLRNRLGYRTWRAVHWMSYACWPVAFLHDLGTGTDTHVRWSLLFSLACLAAVVAAVVWRLVTADGVPVVQRAQIGAAVGALVVALLGWTFTYPTQPGWARRAGTPAALLGATRTVTPPTTLGMPFNALLTGTIHQSPTVGGRATITIDGFLAKGTHGMVRLILVGNVLTGGGVQMDRGLATFGTVARPTLYQGAVVALDGTNVTAKVHNDAGNSVTLSFRLKVNPERTAITGSLSARAGSN
jgi:sulfoxide reductase heme-binding subunit YedZ